MWEEKTFLVCVKTYPEYSMKYIETACTAAILKDTGRLIRIYPLPFRYLTKERQFRKYQWVTAKIEKNPRDYRPESYRIQTKTINLGDTVDSSRGWGLRRRLILAQKQNTFTSLEDLQEQQSKDRSSLGLITPQKINGFRVEKKSFHEIDDERQKKAQIIAQRNFLVEKKELDLIPYRFLTSFICDHPQCKGHEVSILDWEFAQLYRRLSKTNDWKTTMKRKFGQICSEKNDVYFFMGNMFGRPKTFCILGLFYPPKIAGTQLHF